MDMNLAGIGYVLESASRHHEIVREADIEYAAALQRMKAAKPAAAGVQPKAIVQAVLRFFGSAEPRTQIA